MEILKDYIKKIKQHCEEQISCENCELKIICNNYFYDFPDDWDDDVLAQSVFKPKYGDNYWTYDIHNCKIIQVAYCNIPLHSLHKQLGIQFKTKEKAEQYLSTWQEFLKEGKSK